jgi:hypothetical protein
MHLDFDRNALLTAITTHAKLTHGLSLSPTLAHFQKTPSTPFLFLSITPGKSWCAYALVQMMRRSTRRSDWKLNSADCTKENC